MGVGSNGQGARGKVARVVITVGIVVGIVVAVATTCWADDRGGALRELASSTDFRVRVTAALLIGRSKPAGAREALEQALGDSHPAVRLAAADALGTLGDVAAVPALEQHLTTDASLSVKAQIRATLDKLHGVSSGQGEATAHRVGPDVRCVVVLGAMRNASGIRGDDLRLVLSEAARLRVQSLHGVLLSDVDGPLLQQAAARHVPIVVLDGSVSAVSETRADGNVQVRARVEFTVRRDQTLKGTVSGAATTFGSGPTLSDSGRRHLQDDAVSGAVQSALRGADQGLIVAAR